MIFRRNGVSRNFSISYLSKWTKFNKQTWFFELVSFSPPLLIKFYTLRIKNQLSRHYNFLSEYKKRFSSVVKARILTFFGTSLNAYDRMYRSNGSWFRVKSKVGDLEKDHRCHGRTRSKLLHKRVSRLRPTGKRSSVRNGDGLCSAPPTLADNHDHAFKSVPTKKSIDTKSVCLI